MTKQNIRTRLEIDIILVCGSLFVQIFYPKFLGTGYALSLILAKLLRLPAPDDISNFGIYITIYSIVAFLLIELYRAKKWPKQKLVPAIGESYLLTLLIGNGIVLLWFLYNYFFPSFPIVIY